MNLTPKSQAIFQSFFVCKTKEQFSNSYRNKSSLSNRQACSKYKQIFHKPSKTKIQQIGNYDNLQTGCEGLRRITLDESQLTVVGIRKTSRISQFPSYHHQQRKDYWIQSPEKNLSLDTQMNSGDREKESKLIQRIKQQQQNKYNKSTRIKMNVLHSKLLNQNGVDEYNKLINFIGNKISKLIESNSMRIQKQYFGNKIQKNQKIIPEQCDQIRIIIRRQEKTLETSEFKKKENLRNYH